MQKNKIELNQICVESTQKKICVDFVVEDQQTNEFVYKKHIYVMQETNKLGLNLYRDSLKFDSKVFWPWKFEHFCKNI